MSFPQRPPRKGSVPSILLPLDSALPTTTTVQRSLLGGSDTSNLSPTSFEMKLQKRKSDDERRHTEQKKQDGEPDATSMLTLRYSALLVSNTNRFFVMRLSQSLIAEKTT